MRQEKYPITFSLSSKPLHLYLLRLGNFPFFLLGMLTKAAMRFNKLCVEPYPPVFYWWFIQKFSDPNEWFEARTRFALSAAAWSAVGFVIGLGDRHSENILVDTSNGQCVHVDFDW